MGKWEALEIIFAIQLHNNGMVSYVLMADIFGSASNMIWIKHYSWQKQEYEYAMDVYVNEDTMVAYNDHGWIDEFGGFWHKHEHTIDIYINEHVMDAFTDEINWDFYIDGGCI